MDRDSHSHHDVHLQKLSSATDTLTNQESEGKVQAGSIVAAPFLQKEKLDTADQAPVSTDKAPLLLRPSNFPGLRPSVRNQTIHDAEIPTGTFGTTSRPFQSSLALGPQLYPVDPPRERYELGSTTRQVRFWTGPTSPQSVNPVYATSISQSFHPGQQTSIHGASTRIPQAANPITMDWNNNRYGPPQRHRPNPLTTGPPMHFPPSAYAVMPSTNLPQMSNMPIQSVSAPPVLPYGNQTQYPPVPDMDLPFVAKNPFSRYPSRGVRNELPNLITFDDIPTAASPPDSRTWINPSAHTQSNQHGSFNQPQHSAYDRLPFPGYSTPFNAGRNQRPPHARPISPETVHRVLRQPPTPEIPFIPPPLSDDSSLQPKGVGFKASCMPCIGDCLSCLSNFCLWPFSRRPSPEAAQRLPHVWEETLVESNTGFSTVITYVIATLPTQVYLHFLLRLPALYFSRVARIFEEADLTLPEIKKMALETASQDKGRIDFHRFEPSDVPPQYQRLKSTWESFIDSVMREWKTFNIISVLLLSAILTILQIQGAADDPITRYSALSSLICALISLLFGCMYIIPFGSMRKAYKAAEWALEAQRTKTFIWWNVWVLLAMPAIWLTWSIILYIACIMSFVWRSSSQDDAPSVLISKETLLIVRILIRIIYGILILSTFSRYGEAMDRAWKNRIDGWIAEKMQIQSWRYPYSPYVDPISHQPVPYPPYEDRSHPGYRPPPQATPPESDPGMPARYTGPDLGPTYSPTRYVRAPAPEPYTPLPSAYFTPTADVTRLNTMHDLNLNVQREASPSDASDIYAGPSHPTQKPLPHPPKILGPPSDVPQMIVPKKFTPAVPPPFLSIPSPVRETPTTALYDNNTARNLSSSADSEHFSSHGLNIEDRDDESHENRVSPRSPLEFPHGSFFADSSGDGERSSPQSAASSGPPMTLGSTLVAVEPGQDNDSLQRRSGEEIFLTN